MGVGSGIGGQVGFAAESTYGTPVAVTKFLPVVKSSPKLKVTYAQGGGLVAGQLIDSASQRIPTLISGTVAMDVELQSNGLGLLLQTLMGTSVTPVQQGATTAYLQTHTFTDPIGKFLTVQTGIPDTAGVVHPYTATGCKVTEADFSFDINSTTPVMSSWTIDSQNIVESQALSAASYPTGLRPFVGTDVTIKVGTYGSEASVSGVDKVDIKIPRPLKTNRDYFGNAGLKQEPITNGRAQITGTINSDYVDKTIWADRFVSHSMFSLVVEAKGALIATGFNQTFRITLPGCFIEGDTPDLASEDVVNGAFPFVCRFDGTNLPKIEFISTDVTL